MAAATVPTDTSGHDLRAMTTAEDRAKQEVDRKVEDEIDRKIQKLNKRNNTYKRDHAAPTAPTLVQDIQISVQLWLAGVGDQPSGVTRVGDRQTLRPGQVRALMRMAQNTRTHYKKAK